MGLQFGAAASQMRPANYWHMLPEANQARKAIWEGMNPHTGMRRLDEAFPRELIASRRDTDMRIEFRNGSTWQVVGSDNYRSLLSSQPAGIVMSEAARADPGAWSYLQPMLEENGGWALFISTVFGRNWFYELNRLGRDDPSWCVDKISAEHAGVFSPEQLARIRNELIRLNGPDEGDAIYRQDYLSDFLASVPGAYYARLMQDAEDEGRICKLPYDRATTVDTWWDIGVRDGTAIWFTQRCGPWLHWIDYYEHKSAGADHYAQVLHDRAREKGYIYGRHTGPHDARVRDWGAGAVPRIEVLAKLGIQMVAQGAVPLSQAGYRRDGIDALRRLIPRSRFDKEACERGIECLIEYHREWDDSRKIFLDVPYHNWASDGADAGRVCAMGQGDESLPGTEDRQTRLIRAHQAEARKVARGPISGDNWKRL
ncbi:MAG: hypothetical protein IPK75_19010 [Acidobacteria bacterium]|nr:hypothetical protein [Acidobacteriota bacterium]